MKKSILAFVLVSLSFNIFANSSPIAPCSSKDLIDLENSINNWKKEGYTNVSYIKNSQEQILGFYSWGAEGGMHAEVCESIDMNDVTVANDWYYWDGEDSKESPTTWLKGDKYRISQDEGMAFIKIVDVLPDGSRKAKFSIVGWDDNSKLKAVRTDTVIFQNK